MVTNAERNQRTRSAVMNAAVVEVLREGAAGLRLDRVARQAGVNKRMVYVHFGDRSGLVGEVLRHQLRIVLMAPEVHAETRAFLAGFFDVEIGETERSVAIKELHNACRIVLVALAQAPDDRLAAVAVPRRVLTDLGGWLWRPHKPRLNAQSVSKPVARSPQRPG